MFFLNSKKILILSVAFLVFLVPITKVSAVVRTWDRGGGNDNWSTCTNWSDDLCPGSSDIATFDSTSDTASIVDASFAGSVAGVNIATGYNSTISLQRNLAVGANGYVQGTGTFSMGTFTMSVDTVGNFFTSTAFTITGGTFNEDTGTVSLGNGTASVFLNVPSTETFYNLTFNTYSGYNVDLSGDTLLIKNHFSHISGLINNGTINWEGSTATQASGSGGGTATFNFSSTTAAQIFTSNGGTGPRITFNSSDDASDSIIFNANTAFYGIYITSGFSGTVPITNNNYSLTIGGGSFTQDSGTFNAPPTMTINSGGFGGNNFLIVRGSSVFSSPSTTLIIGSSGGANTVYASTTLTVNNLLTHSHPAYAVALPSTEIIVNNTFTQSSGGLSGIVNAKGNVVIGSGAGGGTATLNFTGSNNQTYTDNGGDELNGDVTINKTGGSVTLASNADWNSSGQDLTVTGGTFDQGATFNLLTTALTVGGSGIWSNTGTGDITLGGNVSNSGTVTINGSGSSCGDTDSIQIRSSSNGVQRTWSGAGSYSVTDVDVRDMLGSLTAFSSTNTANNGWTFAGCNTTPDVPTSLAPTEFVDGSWGNDTTPTFTFSLSDSDVSDTIKYQIQIDDTSDFSSAVVDYTSALATQGTATFTVGQSAGSGAYAAGALNQTLSDSSTYYWRARATDNLNAVSSYSVANSGAVAFKIDTVAPATGSLSTTTVTSTSVSVSVTGASDLASGILGTPYLFQNTINLTNSLSTSSTFWVEYGLAANTLYQYVIRVTDGAGNSATSSSLDVYTLPNPPSSSSGQTSSVNIGNGAPLGLFGKVTINVPSNISVNNSKLPLIFIFNKNLSYGQSNLDVKQLQIYLNSHGFEIAKNGPGSSGNETLLFGTLTLNALKKFQCANVVVCSGTPKTTGYGNVGPKTRVLLNK